MVYTIYETNCIVFDLKNLQEDDCLIRAFSDKFGVIKIIAKSFRKSQSKLKANIKAFSVNKIAIVRGREFFRLTDVNHIFSFSNSKSLVSFLRLAESLFFNDERDYFDEINNQVYNMIIHLCKFIIYLIKNNKKDSIEIVNMFFIIYVRSLQGFVVKFDIEEMTALKDNDLFIWFEKESSNIRNTNKKIIL